MLLDPYQSIRIPLMGDIADFCIQFLPKSKTEKKKKALLYEKDFSQQNIQNSLSTMKNGGWSGT